MDIGNDVGKFFFQNGITLFYFLVGFPVTGVTDYAFLVCIIRRSEIICGFGAIGLVCLGRRPMSRSALYQSFDFFLIKRD